MSPSKPFIYLLWGSLIGAVFAAIWAPAARAQFGPLLSPAQAPQAQSEEELDAYLEIVASRDPRTTIKKAELFSSKYSQSQLLGIALQYEMTAQRQLGDLDGVLRAGGRALQLEPGNLNTLLILASFIPTRVAGRNDADKLLRQAEEYAREALQGIDRTKISMEIPLKDWEIRKLNMQSEAHEALGQVALARNQWPAAVSEFEAAIKASPSPTGAQFLRLGVACAKVGQTTRAQVAFRQASSLGPDAVRRLAEDQMAKLTDGSQGHR
jgi:tetratricopeptide (TPR) repeat protein